MILLPVLIPASAFPETAVCADIGFIQDLLFFRNGSRQLNAEIRANVSGTFQFRIPLNYTFTAKASMIDSGILLAVYPFENSGFFAGMTLVQMGYQPGKTVTGNRLRAMHELVSGWTFPTGKRFFLEAQLCIRDPSASFTEEYSEIRGIFPCYKEFRIRLSAGFRITGNFRNTPDRES